MYGTKPSKNTVEAYEAIQDINDTTWQIKSSERLKRVVAEGGIYAELDDLFGNVAYRVSKAPDNELVLDLATMRSVPSNTLKDELVFKIPRHIP